jgi:hypothetical protein
VTAAPVWLQRTLSWIAPALLAGMLLFPSTCAYAAGVHSLFDDPLAAPMPPGHHPALARYAAQYGMTFAELERHVAMGHIVLPTDAIEQPPTEASVAVAEIDPCPSAPKFRDMPSSMLMDNVAAVTTIADPDVISAPIARADVIWPMVQLPAGHLADVESPPPRAVF